MTIEVLTFRDFHFRANHCLSGKSHATAHPHWHAYVVRFWFTNAPDQDVLVARMEETFHHLHGSALHTFMADSSDEGSAKYFLKQGALFGRCVRVRVKNDGTRGAEARKVTARKFRPRSAVKRRSISAKRIRPANSRVS